MTKGKVKSRNPIASAVRKIRFQVIPDKRQRKLDRLSRQSLQRVVTEFT